mmetsp:Transcript_15104/g.20704  ORF Transcript_15104/g.20704 Transcript_15104/m.20704 type:complete len:104 (-) Transcript_15104:39-350(-)
MAAVALSILIVLQETNVCPTVHSTANACRTVLRSWIDMSIECRNDESMPASRVASVQIESSQHQHTNRDNGGSKLCDTQHDSNKTTFHTTNHSTVCCSNKRPN